MEGMTTLRLELGIDAQRIASQVMVNNRGIEENIANGIQRAIDTITEQENFEQMVASATHEAMHKVIQETVNSWSIRQSIQKSLEAKIGDAVEKYGDSVAEKNNGVSNK
jgi:flavin-binding protein dodecin